ncbi:Nse4 C-terminal-domain-containing protein [Dendryphion nanum]|uniref:Non-structural maintenance of chromosomes element 4 n=1 Tax=Dendryphion nanum TaxID=256645 RepID=A0A9P9D3W8_9PLEO|nr:Nse4 C-terminal-domain-containing protein [Dendryphion nanum]
MARLNTHLSATPQPNGRRSTTIDSLYRDPTPSSHLNPPSATSARAARQSSYSVVSPAPSNNSDKENAIPQSRDNTPKPASSRHAGKNGTSRPRLPTPNSGSGTGAGHASKRRRTDTYSAADAFPTDSEDDVGTDENEQTNILDDSHVQDDTDATPDTELDEEEDEETRYYNPQQNPELRRRLRANIRNNHREMEDNRDELIKPQNNLLLSHLRKQDHYMGKVRQTADAALDSRVIVLASDLASKKINNSLNSNNGVGIDIDQFVSRCIFFMTNDGVPAHSGNDQQTQHRRVQNTRPHVEDDDEDPGNGLDWAILGKEACFPSNKRPPVSSFLLGPLSVQKRARATQTRRAKSQRQPVGPATRPQELTQADIKQSENSNLSHLVTTIRSTLKEHLKDAQEQVDAELTAIEGEPDEEDINAACRRHRIRQTKDIEPAVSLFDFVINPKSFGQTVENLFYISFLIREGAVKVDQDIYGLPLLCPSEPHTLQEQRERKIEKHQAVFSIDWPTWKSLINAFDIKQPLIPHRFPEETNLAPGGWYG